MMEFSGLGLTLQLAEDAVRGIVREVRRHRRTETGGVLIGCYSDDLHSVWVAKATGPGRFSLHAPFSFTRGTKDLQAEIEEAEAIGMYYVGEWHSHPGGSVSPSPLDLRQMRAIADDAGYNCPEPVLLVVGSADPRERMSTHVIVDGNAIELQRRKS